MAKKFNYMHTYIYAYTFTLHKSISYKAQLILVICMGWHSLAWPDRFFLGGGFSLPKHKRKKVVWPRETRVGSSLPKKDSLLLATPTISFKIDRILDFENNLIILFHKRNCTFKCQDTNYHVFDCT